MSYDYICKKCATPFKSPKKNKQYCSHNCFAKRFDAVTKQCETCHKDFTVAYRFREQKTCGTECAKTAISKTLTTRVVKQCLHCGDDYEATQAYKDDAKYCSYNCFLQTRKTRQPDVVKNCEHCKKDFTVPFTKAEQRFCGYSCANSGEHNAMFGVKGEQHPTHGQIPWNSGLTTKTDPRLRALGEKISTIISDKMVAGTWSPPTTGYKGEHYRGVKNCQGKVPYLRSSYESTFARMLDEDPEVASWEHEPMRIPYVFEGSVHNYVPDFLVTRTDGKSFLVEVKPSLLTDTPANQAKMKAALTWCELNDVGYLSVTEENLSSIYPQ